ncbi:unnamed protein product [Mytilus coruscus]|uniref:Mutator-like transposase domain-containing protein n=1 Tax=Mytilus coruscus TaxID=42192 RepID=A0A6J7ZYJ4_MYTCO|nr:unnamed protein product [Mytilus coruscus]
MKGSTKRKKGHFSTLKQPDSNRNGSSKGLKVKDVKRTYLKLKKTAQKKVDCIPRSVQLVAANNELPKNFETTVLLRPKQDSSSFLDFKTMTAENIIRPSKDFIERQYSCSFNKGYAKFCDKVNEKIEIQNLADMVNIRTELKTINKMRGHPESHIDVEGDGCYNNPLYSGIGKTPFQPATQSCYAVVENMTDKKLVINLVTKNKLCNHGKDHSNENINNKNCKCTQNLQMVESIGNEQQSASESLTKLYSEGFEVRHITTDPDSI